MIEKLIETSPGTLVALTAIVCGTTFLVVCVVSITWYHLRVHARDVDLKRELLGKGMSAPEVERVVWVSSVNAPKGEALPEAETLSANERELIEKMLDEGWQMEDIERLVRALKSAATHRPGAGYFGGFVPADSGRGPTAP